MKRALMVGLSGLLVACGHSIWPTSSVVTPMGVSVAFACADSVAKRLGYKPFQSKPDEGFLRARKLVTDGSRDIFDQQPYDQLKIEVVDSARAGTTITVTAESYTEQLSRRGRDQVEKPARPAVIVDARALLAACGTASAERPDQVPDVN
jgi:hypothetical protein